MRKVGNNGAKIADRETKQDIAAYTEILAGLRFEKDFIRLTMASVYSQFPKA